MSDESGIFFDEKEEDLVEKAIENFLILLNEEKARMINKKQIEDSKIDFDIKCCQDTLDKFYDTPTLNAFDIQVIYLSLTKYLDFLNRILKNPSVNYVQKIRNEKAAVTAVINKIEPTYRSLKQQQ